MVETYAGMRWRRAVRPQNLSEAGATLVCMDIDPHFRALAGRTLLDAVVSLDLDDHGTDKADNAVLLALDPLGLGELDARTAAALAASLDLLWFLTYRIAKTDGVEHEELLSNLRALLPTLFPVPEDD